MDFYQRLESLGKLDMISPTEYVSPRLSMEEDLYALFHEMFTTNEKCLVVGDYDPDGAMSSLIIEEAFNHIGYKNFDVVKYSLRTHNVDKAAVTKAITGNYKYFIVSDTGSSEPEVFRRLASMGIKSIIFDHHQTGFSPEDFEGTILVNTTVENRNISEPFVLSSGALVYIVMEKLIRRMGLPPLDTIAPLALVSLYADSVDMSSELNRSIYYKAINPVESRIPKVIERFMGTYDRFTRRFIEYKFSPKINSLFRSESFDLLNRYLFWTPNSGEISEIFEEINNIYTKYREEINKASDIIEPLVLDNFVIGNLTSIANYIDIAPDKLYNYTGLVANKLANKYGKTCVVYADSGTNIKASLRDLYGRDYLSLFKQFSDANGHNSAFGINIDYMEFSNFISYLKIIDKQFFIENVPNEPLIVEHNFRSPNKKLMEDMALYNEFSGTGSPIALVGKVWTDTSFPRNGGFYYYRYRWGDFTIRSTSRLILGHKVLIKPYRGYGTELIVTKD